MRKLVSLNYRSTLSRVARRTLKLLKISAETKQFGIPSAEGLNTNVRSWSYRFQLPLPSWITMA